MIIISSYTETLNRHLADIRRTLKKTPGKKPSGISKISCPKSVRVQASVTELRKKIIVYKWIERHINSIVRQYEPDSVRFDK